MDKPWLVDVDPVLRYFGATKKLARERFELFVNAGLKVGRREDLYGGAEGRLLGAEEFVEAMKNRVGEVGKAKVKKGTAKELGRLICAVEEATLLKRAEICSGSKKRAVVIAKEAMIIVGREVGGSSADLARLIGVDISVVSRRFECGSTRMHGSTEMQKLVNEVRKLYNKQESES
jgi:hypothetical protein